MPSKDTFPAPNRHADGCCDASDLILAERFNLALALVDKAANICVASSEAARIMKTHPAILKSANRLGLSSASRSKEFRFALRCAFSGQQLQTLRGDDGCQGAPLALQVSSWKCQAHCLVNFHPLEPKPIDLAPLRTPFNLTRHQTHLLEDFSTGAILADMASRHRVQPQTMRGIFSGFYRTFEVGGQLELLSALKSIPLIRFE